MIEMNDRKEKRFVHCPVCGKCLMKANGTAEIETKCDRCGRDIIAIIRGGMVSVSEERRGKASGHQGAVSISISKQGGKKAREMQKQQMAANF